MRSTCPTFWYINTSSTLCSFQPHSLPPVNMCCCVFDCCWSLFFCFKMSLFVVVFFLCESLLYIFCDKWYYEFFYFLFKWFNKESNLVDYQEIHDQDSWSWNNSLRTIAYILKLLDVCVCVDRPLSMWRRQWMTPWLDFVEYSTWNIQRSPMPYCSYRPITFFSFASSVSAGNSAWCLNINITTAWRCRREEQ